MGDAKTTSATLLAQAAGACRDNPSAENQRRLKMAGAFHGSAPRLARMSEMSRSEPGMNVASPAEFNRDPYALATHNGIVDLRTAALRPARPKDLVSKLAGCEFHPDAPAPRWESFLATILPDPEVRAFVQRAAGYSLTGDVGEERFFVMHGTGANGKSVFGAVLAAALGEYAGSFGAALVTKNRNDSEASRLVAALPGLRLASVDETAPGDMWDAARVKSLASREALSARLLYGEAFSFAPTHHLWIRTNILPGSTDASDGFWRRCVPIPFTTQVPEESRVPDLDRRIIARELPGVLAWAVRGAVAWAEGGLGVPAGIRAEAQAYRKETDLLGQWLDERTEPDPKAMVTSKDAFADYREFCQELGVGEGSSFTFGKALKSRGFHQAADTSKRRWVGLRLLSRAEASFDDEEAA